MGDVTLLHAISFLGDRLVWHGMMSASGIHLGRCAVLVYKLSKPERGSMRAAWF